jgi:small subunit ribosomal protein S20
MPRTSSTKKALRQSLKRYQRNLKKKQEIKKLIRLVKQSVAKNDAAQARQYLSSLYQKLDKASKTFIPKNRAARLKSRLARKVKGTGIVTPRG